ncbi:ribosome production factor 1-like [Littorina saxatilis]|uniref:Brix domain-containing protein n=1 Tax=Littorina saxatilis TaxID=31220 RepID=A0AAN9G9T1_9CAEN
MASTSQIEVPTWNISEIKNKNRRTELYREMKKKKRMAKIEEKKARMKEAKAKGEKAPPKGIPKTMENMRVYDETVVNPNDEEVMADEATDETAPYHTGQSEPKIMITTCDRPGSRTNKLCKEFKKIIPNSTVFYRRGLDLKKIIPQAMSRSFTDIVVINENMKVPNALVVTHLPDGPTAHFRMSNVKLTTEIKGTDGMSDHRPEVILNNFSTRLGHSVGRLLASLFNADPNYVGRRVVTFHNQRDFIFFRQHRYEFKSGKKVALKELGPRFTLKLRSLQKGTFDSKHGQYEWVHKRHEMDTSRRKFYL